MCSAPNVYMFVYILIGTHMVPLSQILYMGRIVILGIVVFNTHIAMKNCKYCLL